MPQIDPRRIQRNAQHIFINNGDVVTVRRFVSASQGNAAFGVANTFSYANQIVTALVTERSAPVEVNMPGGIHTQGEIAVSLPFEMSQRDYLTWNGSAYTVDGAIITQTIGGQVQYQTPLKLMSRTAI